MMLMGAMLMMIVMILVDHVDDGDGDGVGGDDLGMGNVHDGDDGVHGDVETPGGDHVDVPGHADGVREDVVSVMIALTVMVLVMMLVILVVVMLMMVMMTM